MALEKMFSNIGLEDAEEEAEEKRISAFFEGLPADTYMIQINDNAPWYTEDIGHDVNDVFESMAIKEGIEVYCGINQIWIKSYYGGYSDICYIKKLGKEWY